MSLPNDVFEGGEYLQITQYIDGRICYAVHVHGLVPEYRISHDRVARPFPKAGEGVVVQCYLANTNGN